VNSVPPDDDEEEEWEPVEEEMGEMADVEVMIEPQETDFQMQHQPVQMEFQFPAAVQQVRMSDIKNTISRCRYSGRNISLFLKKYSKIFLQNK
jgi:hypothetical protein